MKHTTTQITVRGVDLKLKKLIDAHAKKRDISINQFMLEIAKDAVSHTKPHRGSWRELSGLIPDEGFNDKIFEDFEKIDPEMWK